MVTGASTADLALVLVDARQGVVRQSRRHAFLASLLRIPHLVVCVNKMDLVGFDERAFRAVVDDFSDFAAKLDGVRDTTFVPISALEGDNVVTASQRTPWYLGPPLLEHLETVEIAADRDLAHPRFPVQWVIRPQTAEHHDFRGYAGQVAGGVLRAGDPVLVLPSGAQTRVQRVETFDGPVEEAAPPMSVTVHLEDDLDVSRGDLLCSPDDRPLVAAALDATLCWMDEVPSAPRGRYLLKHTTRTTKATLARVEHRIDVDTLAHDAGVDQLELNDIGRVTLRTAAPLAFDPYAVNRATGSFVLVDEVTNHTVAAGMLHGVADEGGAVWQAGELSRETRWSALGLRGATVWLTGLPASGKSTIAARVEQRLVAAGVPAYRLDGDNLRHGLNAGLGFSDADRTENVRRTGEAAKLLADAGLVVLVSLVSPFAADRDAARAAHEADELPFVEVHVDTPVEECERRDPKGLYARARAGELRGLTGVDAPYEAPAHPELVLDGAQDLDASVARVLRLLDAWRR